MIITARIDVDIRIVEWTSITWRSGGGTHLHRNYNDKTNIHKYCVNYGYVDFGAQ